MNSAQIISDFIKSVADNAMPFATAMAAIGVLSMAIIQTLKDMLPLRNIFQRRYLIKWLRQKANEAKAIEGSTPEAATAESDLIRLATAGDRKAFYDLPIEQLCGQMNAALQVVFDYPHEHKDLLHCLAAHSSPDDIRLLITPRSSADVKTKEQNQIDARTRVMHQVQRALDGFQIAVGYRWKLYLQIAAFSLSYLLTVIGLSLHSGINAVPNNIMVIVVTGIISGFLAPIARDLVASLQKLRG